MKETDRSFNLTHEQLIKVTAILLYKFNLSAQKNHFQRIELTKMMTERINRTEALFKSRFIEINEFLHTVHQEFEQFVASHKKEHIGVNLRLLKSQDDLAQLTSHLSQTRQLAE